MPISKFNPRGAWGAALSYARQHLPQAATYLYNPTLTDADLLISVVADYVQLRKLVVQLQSARLKNSPPTTL